MGSVRQGGIRRFGLRWALPFVCIFVIPLAITAVRVQYRERMGHIESLERTLSERRADEAYLTVAIERACGYAEVQREARDHWNMKVARREQRYFLSPGPLAETAAQAALEEDGSIVDRARGFLRGGVAQARSATDERTVRALSR